MMSRGRARRFPPGLRPFNCHRQFLKQARALLARRSQRSRLFRHCCGCRRRVSRRSSQEKSRGKEMGAGSADLVEAAPRTKNFGDSNRSIGLLVVFQQCDQGPGNGDRGSIERVHELGPLLARRTATDAQSTGLIVGAIGGRRDLSPRPAISTTCPLYTSPSPRD